MLQVQRHYCSQQVIELWQLSVGGTYIPDRTLVIFEHQNQRIDKFDVVQKTDRRGLLKLLILRMVFVAGYLESIHCYGTFSNTTMCSCC